MSLNVIDPPEEVTKPLSRKDEREAIELWRETKDEKLRERILLSQYGFVRKQAVKLARPRANVEDLINAGMVGVMRALELFDPSRGVRFITYASQWVLHEMTWLIGQNRSILTATTLMRGAGEDGDKLNEKRWAATEVPLQDEYSGYVDDTRRHMAAVLSVDSIAEEEAGLGRDIAVLQDLMEVAGLTPNEKVTLELKWLREKAFSAQQIADMLGVSRQAVVQYEGAAFQKIKDSALHFKVEWELLNWDWVEEEENRDDNELSD